MQEDINNLNGETLTALDEVPIEVCYAIMGLMKNRIDYHVCFLSDGMNNMRKVLIERGISDIKDIVECEKRSKKQGTMSLVKNLLFQPVDENVKDNNVLRTEVMGMLQANKLNSESVDVFLQMFSKYPNTWICMILPTVFCSDKKYSTIRYKFLRDCNVYHVVHLPSHLFSESDQGYSIIVGYYERDTSVYAIEVIDTATCAPLPFTEKCVVQADCAELTRVVTKRDPLYTHSIKYLDLGSHNYSLMPKDYNKGCDDETFYTLLDLVDYQKPNRLGERAEGLLLGKSDFTIDGIPKTRESEQKGTAMAGSLYYDSPHLLVSSTGLLYTHPNNNVLLIPNETEHFIGLRIDTTKVYPSYLSWVLARLKDFRYKIIQLFKTLEAAQGSHLPVDMPFVVRTALDKIRVCILNDIDAQKNVIDNVIGEIASHERQRYEWNKATNDLVHMIGTPSQNIRVLLEELEESNVASDITAALCDNFDYMIRIMKYANSNLSEYHEGKKKLIVVDFIQKYKESWKHFGKRNFTLVFTLGLDLDGSSKILINPDMLALLLDAILNNAAKHGFPNSNNKDNKVEIFLTPVSYIDTTFMLISVRNNGLRMPEGFTIVQYASRGAYAGKTGNSGLGGYHVYSIVKNNNGYLGIRSDNEWNVIIDILFPIIDNINTNFTAYNYECI